METAEGNKKLSKDEWLELITCKINSSKYGYYMSWWLRIDTGFATPYINYNLKKLVKAGLLESESNCYGIKYRSPNTQTK